jgi:hypothetical protein
MYSLTDYINNINLLQAGWTIDTDGALLKKFCETIDGNGAILNWEILVHYSEIWQIPVLYFRISNTSGEAIKDIDKLLRNIVSGANQNGLQTSLSMVVGYLNNCRNILFYCFHII